MIGNIVARWVDYCLIGELSPHRLRRTAITPALDQGLSYRQVQTMLGHWDRKTSQEILAQLFFIELIGRRTVECRQLPHGPQIGLLCTSAEPAELLIARQRSRKHPLRRRVHNARPALVRSGT